MNYMNLKIIGLALSISFPVFADLKVGTVLFEPPFIMSPTQGFDIDLMKLLCIRLKEKCTIIPMDFNKLFSALDSGQVDLAIGGIVISDERKKKFIFSTPYLLSKAQFLILSKNKTITSVDALAKSNVGVIKGEEEGGTFYNYLIDNHAEQFKVIEFNDMEDIINALTDGSISAAFLHKSTANYWIENGGGQFQDLGKDMLLGDGLGIMALSANIKLIQRLNQQLIDIEKGNSYLNLYNMYFANE